MSNNKNKLSDKKIIDINEELEIRNNVDNYLRESGIYKDISDLADTSEEHFRSFILPKIMNLRRKIVNDN